MLHHLRTKAVLSFIAGYQEAHGGISPTLTTIMTAIRVPGKGNMHHMLTVLERANLIRREKHRQQWIEVLFATPIPRDPDGAPLYFVPMGAL